MRIGSVKPSKSGAVDDPRLNTFISANDGMNFDTGSVNCNLPSSHSIIAATDVSGFVIE